MRFVTNVESLGYLVIDGFVQVQALQAQEEEGPKTIFVSDFADPELENAKQVRVETILQVSMHAAMGIGAMKNTFILTVKVGDYLATTMVNSGSTSTFVSPEMASKMLVKPRATPRVKVAVASGEMLWSEFMVQDCAYEILDINSGIVSVCYN